MSAPLPLPPSRTDETRTARTYVAYFDALAVATANATANAPTTVLSTAFAAHLDAIDPLAPMRDEFNLPRAHPYTPDAPRALYFVGNSLGAQPKRAAQYVREEMEKWHACAVEGHFAGERPWVNIDEPATALAVDIVGAAHADEIALMNSLSCNLHLLLTSFYRPTAKRFKILIEEAAFCSDHHVVRSQIELHGLSVADTLIQLQPSDSTRTYLTTEEICSAIAAAGDSLAVVLLPGVQFYTGQFFDIATITRAAHQVGAYAGWDLAHAVGNVPLRLHDWDVDFAAWCSYKYLNSGAGSIAGAFLHSKHANKSNAELPKLRGWWGQEPHQRFRMLSEHVAKPGAQAFMLSNPPVLPMVCVQASLETFAQAGGIDRLRAKSEMLTSFLELALEPLLARYSLRVLTPPHIVQRGCQLSLLFPVPIRPIVKALELRGLLTDGREPNVIRISPAPLYNSFSDVWRAVQVLDEVLAVECPKAQQ